MKSVSICLSLTAFVSLCTSVVADAEPARILTFFTKKAGLTEADFHHHWTNVHGPLVVPWALKYGVNRYTQYHTTESNRSSLQKALQLPDDYLLNYDGAADFTVSSLAEFLSAYADPYYKQVIAPDEESLFLHSGDVMVIRGTMGWTSEVVKDGVSAVDATPGCTKWKEIHGSAGEGCA
ncbi:hypothetical protein AK830_g6059 [Neonectria ditissima]|uniref:EthD domain-containing protein n=1 Tax=Neonectria ditissima TaxID=78410 RepID=A0A0P7ARW6_9HYPO|nr:hypothetical protein AK830_g6059 [Neonectria ditissima]